MPFSLGNELQLFREDNPFMTLERDEFDELSTEQQCFSVIRAVNICCCRPPRLFKLWSWKNNGCPIRLWPFRKSFYLSKGVDYVLAVAEFRNYLADGRLQFRADLPADDDLPIRFVGEPELLRLYRFLNAHIPREEIKIWGVTAWDFPYSLAKMLCQGHAEGAGSLSIYNLKQKTHDDYHAQCEAAYAAWTQAGEDRELRAVALEKHPIIRDLPALAEELAKFDAPSISRTDESTKGDVPCPA